MRQFHVTKLGEFQPPKDVANQLKWDFDQQVIRDVHKKIV